jgi:selenocysteine lyase/cysteine desulfurase
MFSRKKFIQQSGLAIAGLILPKIALANASAQSQGTLDDGGIINDFTIDENTIFLNNGTMGPSPKPVVDAMIEGLEDVTKHTLYGRRKVEAIDNLAAFVGANKDEICLTNNVTHGINIMVWGVPLKVGDEIILTTHEHVGNATPWLYRAQQDKLKVKSVPLGATAHETFEIIKKAITPKTKVLALPHMPCSTGQILPLKEICAYAKSKNIFTCIDGAHGTGMLQLNLKDIGCDYYASCGHKWLLAAQGTGFLYVNKEKLNLLKPKFYGAEGTAEFNTVVKDPYLKLRTDVAARFMYGTQSGALWNSVTAAINYQNNLGRDNIENYVKDLSKYLYEGLSQFNSKLNILTPLEEKSRGGVIAIKLKNKETKDLYTALVLKKIITRYVAENNINCLRISTHIYNNKNQIDLLLKEIEAFV